MELALFSRDPVSLLRAALPSLRNPVSDVEIGQQGRLEAFLSHLRLHPSRRWLWRALPHVQVSDELCGSSGGFRGAVMGSPEGLTCVARPCPEAQLHGSPRAGNGAVFRSSSAADYKHRRQLDQQGPRWPSVLP